MFDPSFNALSKNPRVSPPGTAAVGVSESIQGGEQSPGLTPPRKRETVVVGATRNGPVIAGDPKRNNKEGGLRFQERRPVICWCFFALSVCLAKGAREFY